MRRRVSRSDLDERSPHVWHRAQQLQVDGLIGEGGGCVREGRLDALVPVQGRLSTATVPVSKVATCFPGMFVVSPQRPAPGQAVVDVRRHAAVAMVEQSAAVVCLGRDGAGALPPPVHGLVPSAGVAMSVCTRSATASAGLGSIAAEASLW